ncbi:MAG TPA: YHS domain-containing protein, partial [Saprospiraceae bacterium]|nr:YHS domain-containing protein [Saprospiraceae bacterium]HNL38976.1 YHS domain-containing protein [Saprospiraceae bacterium]HNM26559.1 YHS domain-containing protein [Saprospiraceae bacterium]
MKFQFLFGVAVFAFALGSCQQSAAPNTNNTGSAGTPAQVQLASDTDPVCGMQIDASVTDTAHYQGKVYGFCNPSCKEEFAANPQEYLTSAPAKQ